MKRRDLVWTWLETGLRAVDPEPLVNEALAGQSGQHTIIAIGKAATAMCRGAAQALSDVGGLCISNVADHLPAGFRLMIGDHPIPGDASLRAGTAALEAAPEADLALISGGGSALCEVPLEGLSIEYVARANRILLDSGATIAETNQVRASLSQIKCGGLGPLPTYILSDVPSGQPELVSSGPTIPTEHDPAKTLAIMRRFGIVVDDRAHEAVMRPRKTRPVPDAVEVLADGQTAVDAIVRSVNPAIGSHSYEGWLNGPVAECVENFIANAGSGVTVASGEPSVAVEGNGKGGRNTHSALVAAAMIAGTEMIFAALATDGDDGTAGSAGAIVDGSTVARGGDPTRALAQFDSATYLGRSGDLLETGTTGTNVADLWLIWKP